MADVIQKKLWTFKVYPEHFGDTDPISAIKECLECRDFAISPLHDKDTNSDGTFKKPHYHVNILFDTRRTQNAVIKILINSFCKYGGDVVGNFSYICDDDIYRSAVQPAKGSQRHLDRYLCHLDCEDKYQYSRDDITVCGFYQLCLSSNSFEQMDNVINIVFDNRICSMSQLVKYCQNKKLYNELKYISKNSYFIQQLLKH